MGEVQEQREPREGGMELARDIEGNTHWLEAMKNRRQSRMIPAGIHIMDSGRGGRGGRQSFSTARSLGAIGE